MTEQDFLRAFAKIDPQYIAEAEQRPAGRKSPFLRAIPTHKAASEAGSGADAQRPAPTRGAVILKRTLAVCTAIAVLAAWGFAALKLTDLRLLTRQPQMGAVTPQVTAQSGLPDLSVLGVDTGEFTKSDVPFERPLAHGRAMFAGEIPTVRWTRWTNGRGAVLVFDEAGRLRVFANDTNIRKGETVGTETYYSYQLRRQAHRVLEPLTADFPGFRDSLKNSTETDNGAAYLFSMTREAADHAADALTITMGIDGRVRDLQIDYCDITDTADTAALEEEFVRYLETVPAQYGDSFRSLARGETQYFAYGGAVYGAFSYTVSLGSADAPASDSQTVIFRSAGPEPEHEPVTDTHTETPETTSQTVSDSEQQTVPAQTTAAATDTAASITETTVTAVQTESDARTTASTARTESAAAASQTSSTHRTSSETHTETTPTAVPEPEETVPAGMLNVYEYAESKGFHLIDPAGFYRSPIVSVPDQAKFEGYIPGYRDGYPEQFNAKESAAMSACSAFSMIRLNLKAGADYAPPDGLLGAFADENGAVTYGRVNGTGFANLRDYGLQKNTPDRVLALLDKDPAAAACVESVEYTPFFLQAVSAADLEALFAAVEQAFPGTILMPSPLAGSMPMSGDSTVIWRAP